MAERRKKSSKTSSHSESSELRDSPLVPLRSLMPSVGGDLEGIHFEDRTILDVQSSVESESSLSYPSHEPSLLDQLRAGLAQGKDAREILQSKRRRDTTIKFSLSSSSGSLNSTANISLPPERRRTNPLKRKKKNDIAVDFTMNDTKSSQGFLDSTSNISLPLERPRATNPLTRKNKKDLKLNFTMNDTASSCDNVENESPVLPTTRLKPLFKKPANRKPSIPFDDISDSDTSKGYNDSLLTADIQSQPNPLNSSLQSKASHKENIPVDIELNDSASSAKSETSDSTRDSGPPSSVVQLQALNHDDLISKLEPKGPRRSQRSSVQNKLRNMNGSYDLSHNDSANRDKPLDVDYLINSGLSSNTQNQVPNHIDPSNRLSSLNPSLSKTTHELNTTFDIPTNSANVNEKSMAQVELNGPTANVADNIDEFNEVHSEASCAPCELESGDLESLGPRDLQGSQVSRQTREAVSESLVSNETGVDDSATPKLFEVKDTNRIGALDRKKQPQSKHSLPGPSIQSNLEEELPELHHSCKLKRKKNDITINFTLSDTTSIESELNTPNVRGEYEPLLRKKSNRISIAFQPNDDTADTSVDNTTSADQGLDRIEEQRGKANGSVAVSGDSCGAQSPNASLPVISGVPTNPLKKHLRSNKISIPYKCDETVDECTDTLPLPSGTSSNPLMGRRWGRNKISLNCNLEDTADDDVPSASGAMMVGNNDDENPITQSSDGNGCVKNENQETLEELAITSNVTQSSDAVSLRCYSDDTPQSLLDYDSESVKCSQDNSELHSESCNKSEEISLVEGHPVSGASRSSGPSMEEMRLELSVDESLQYSGMDSSSSIANLDHRGEILTECSKVNEAEPIEDRDQLILIGTTQDSSVCMSQTSLVLRRSRRGSKNVTMPDDLSNSKGSLSEIAGVVGMLSKSHLNPGSRQCKTSEALPDLINSLSFSGTDIEASRCLSNKQTPITQKTDIEASRCLNNTRTPITQKSRKSVSISSKPGLDDEPIVQGETGSKVVPTVLEVEELSTSAPGTPLTHQSPEKFEKNESNPQSISRDAVSLASGKGFQEDKGDIEPIVVAPKEPHVMTEPNIDQLRSSLEPPIPSELCGIRKPSLCSSPPLCNQELPIFPASPDALPTVGLGNQSIVVSPVVLNEPETLNVDSAPPSPKIPISPGILSYGKASDDGSSASATAKSTQTTATSLHLHLTTFDTETGYVTNTPALMIHSKATETGIDENSKYVVQDNVNNGNTSNYVSSKHLGSPERVVSNNPDRLNVDSACKGILNDGKASDDVSSAPPAAQTVQTTATSLHLHLTTFDTEAGDANNKSGLIPSTATETGIDGNSKYAVHDNINNSVTNNYVGSKPLVAPELVPESVVCNQPEKLRIDYAPSSQKIPVSHGMLNDDDVGSPPPAAQIIQTTATSIHLQLADTEAGDGLNMPAPILLSEEAECIPPVTQNSKPDPPTPRHLNPIAGPTGISDKADSPKSIAPRKSKRKSVSFKPPSENLYHSPPSVDNFQQLDRNVESRVLADNGYEFSRIQMTTDISEIQPSPGKKKAEKHFTSTPILKPKKPVFDNIFALPQPLASEQLMEHQFVVPPTVPLTKRVSIQPVPDIITPQNQVESDPINSEGVSSSSISDDVSCEKSLDISAIPKDVTAPKWRKAPHFIHSTPLHRPRASLKRIIKKSEQPAAEHPAVIDDSISENQRKAQVVNHSVQTSCGPITRSKTSIESGTGSEALSQSSSESRSIRRSARRIQTPVPTFKPSSNKPGENGPVDNSPANRIAIHDNTVLSTRIESQSRTRGSRTHSTTGSGFKSYDSHRKIASRRLFNDEVEKGSTGDHHPNAGTESSPRKDPAGGPPSSNDAALTSQQVDDLMSPTETSIAHSYEPSLSRIDGNMSIIADQRPEDDSDNESVISDVSAGSSNSIPSHVVMRQSFESQLSSLRHQSHHHRKEKVGPEEHHRASERMTLRSKFAIPKRQPSSELDLIYPVDLPAKKRKLSQTTRVKLFNPGRSWKKSKQLYDWLKKKLDPTCKTRTIVESELLVIELDRARILVAQGHATNAIDACVERLNRLKICTNQLELWGFFMKFMPFEFIREVVPLGGAFGKPFELEQSFMPYDPI